MKSAKRRARLPQRRHGVTVIYLTAGMIIFAGFVSLAIDVAHVWLVHAELQQAADAAVRYGLTGLSTSVTTAQNNAVSAAGDNTADGTSVVLNPSTDIDFGTWTPSTKTFTVLTGAAQSGANALRVRASRSAAKGNAVTCFFGSVLGYGSTDVHAAATGYFSGGYGLVGLAGIKLSGNSSIGYWAPTGTTNSYGSIASDGDITLSGNSNIQGDARPGPGQNVSLSGSASVSGSTAPLPAFLTYPNASAGSAATTNNDSAASPYWNSGSNDFNLGGSSSVTLPGGVYYFHNFNTAGQASLTFSGPATVYVYGDMGLSGSTYTSGSLPKNLSIEVIGNGNVNLSGSSALYASVYAPQSQVNLSGSGAIYGSILGWSISTSGTSNIYYDLSLPGGWNISMVQ